jgi:hypothetical protein
MFREAYLVKRISYLIASGRYLGGVFKRNPPQRDNAALSHGAQPFQLIRQADYVILLLVITRSSGLSADTDLYISLQFGLIRQGNSVFCIVILSY